MRLTLITAFTAALLFATSNPLPASEHVAGVTPAIAAANVVAQAVQVNPPTDVKIDVNLGDDRGTVWYYNPVWIAVGLLTIVVVGLVVGMAARGGGATGATIVK